MKFAEFKNIDKLYHLNYKKIFYKDRWWVLDELSYNKEVQVRSEFNNVHITEQFVAEYRGLDKRDNVTVIGKKLYVHLNDKIPEYPWHAVTHTTQSEMLKVQRQVQKLKTFGQRYGATRSEVEEAQTRLSTLKNFKELENAVKNG